MSTKINVTDPPKGRFIYSRSTNNQVGFEGQFLDAIQDPDGGYWVKLQPGLQWEWANEVFVEVELPALAAAPAAAAVQTSGPEQAAGAESPPKAKGKGLFRK